MKKTISIHLGKQQFTIEEDAYQRLNNYLKSLESSFNNEDGTIEIMEDIEMRCAELLSQQTANGQQVVTSTNVDAAIKSLGHPEEINDATSDENMTKTVHDSQQNEPTNQSKRLFRDVENGSIAGVCTGLGNYLNVDPIIIKIIFIILLVLGFSVLIYIVLWIVVPNAKTPADKLKMKGKAVTVDAIKEEIENAANRFEKSAHSFARKVDQKGNELSNRFENIGLVIGKLFGIIFIFISFVWLVVFVLLLSGNIEVIPITGDYHYTSLKSLLALALPVSQTFQLFWAAIWLIGLGAPFFFITLGIRMLLGNSKKIISVALLLCTGCLIVGVLLAIIGGFQIARDFSVVTEIENNQLTTNVDSLYVEEMPIYSDNKKIITTKGIDFIQIENKRIIEEGVNFTYRVSSDSLFHIRQLYTAHGETRKKAIERAFVIHHPIEIKGNKLLISPFYSYPMTNGFRSHNIEIIIEVPTDKKLFINNILAESTLTSHGMIYAGETINHWIVGGSDDE
jgi:phage shock protein PspC (stress-responsive transcriptional regulator)